MDALTTLERILITKADLEKAIERVATKASKIAIETYKCEKSKKEFLTTGKAAKQLGCHTRTTLNYIQRGHKNGTKLKAKFNGKEYRINQFDLDEFQKKTEVI